MSRPNRRTVVCERCRRLKTHESRGLCKCCYNHLREHRCRTQESLADYPCAGETATNHRSRGGVTGEDTAGVAPSSSQILAAQITAGASREDVDLHTTIQNIRRPA